jgi:protein TonB
VRKTKEDKYFCDNEVRMKSLLTLLMLFLIPIACAAESQPIEPRVKPAYPAKAEKKGYRVRLKRNLTLMRMGG